VLREAGHDVTDVGQQREDETVRYYEAGELLARAIQSGAYERGFVMCGSGAGVCMTAGKFRGVYAVACESEYTAAELRRITNANVMAMGEKVVTPAVAGRYGAGICGQRLVRRHDAGQSRYGTRRLCAHPGDRAHAGISRRETAHLRPNGNELQTFCDMPRNAWQTGAGNL
jgi:RpiB/LacA/LacB family sugar-phosphate isomerase